jgi:hypothetical protein
MGSIDPVDSDINIAKLALALEVNAANPYTTEVLDLLIMHF